MEEQYEEEFMDEEEMAEYANFRVSALDLAIKASGAAGRPREPEEVLKIAKDYYKFIIGKDE